MPPPAKKHRIAFQAYYWRSSAIAELDEIHRVMQVHRRDIVRLQERLQLRVTGIDDAIAHLAQAATILNSVPTTSRVPGRSSGRPRKLLTLSDALPGEAAE